MDNMKDRGTTERMVDTASCKVRLSAITGVAGTGTKITWKTKDIYNTLLIMDKHKCQKDAPVNI